MQFILISAADPTERIERIAIYGTAGKELGQLHVEVDLDLAELLKASPGDLADRYFTPALAVLGHRLARQANPS